MRWLVFSSLAAALGLASLPADAQVRHLDLGKRSNVAEKRVDMEVRPPQMNERFSGRAMDMREWHGQFSTLGQRRAPMNTDTDRYPVRMREMGRFKAPKTEITLAPQDQQMATMRNLNVVRDRVMAHRFAGSQVRTPEGRHFQDMVDGISLRQLNRFQSMRNKTDDGIPVQTAGSGQKGTIHVSGDANKSKE